MNTATTLSRGSRIQLDQHRAVRAGMLLLLLLLVLPSVVQAQFTYTINNGTITITGYTGPGGAVTIPSTIASLPVASIGGYAFYNCTNLTRVSIPDSVTSMGDAAFAACTSLTAITVNPQNMHYNSVAGVLFNNSQTTLITYPGGKAGGYTIPNSVTNIGGYAFSDCSRLTSVTLGNSVTSIGDSAFSYCISLTDVTLPNGVTSIGEFAFSGCSSLTSVTIPNSVTSIVAWAFAGCSGLKSVTIPDSVTSIGSAAFQYCTSLTNVTIGNSVVSIGSRAFYFCASLTAVTVDALNSVYSSVDGVLFNKSQTTLIQCPEGKAGEYTIPNSVTWIADFAIEECHSLTSVTIPNGVTSIGDQAFYFCTRLTTITIPNSVTSIGRLAFCLCANLSSVTIPNNVTSILDATFQDCYRLTSVTIGNGVTSVGYGAFSSCTNLTSVTIGNSVTSIGIAAFGGCASLTSVTIPNTLTTIGGSAFASCTNLTSILFQGNAPTADSSIFDGDSNATVYYLSGTTGWGTTFGGRPAVLWNPPTLLTSPQTQTAEAGSAVDLWVHASSPIPLFYLWYLNDTNLLSSGTNWQLDLPTVQWSQSGAYTVVISNAFGAVTSAPAMLNVIAAVGHRPVPGVKVTGEAASLWNVDYANSLTPAPNWIALSSVSLTSTSQYCFDVTLPLPPERFYRAWQTGTPSVRPSLNLHLVQAITLTGTIDGSVRLDYIDKFGPIDAWVTLATVTLTNTSQLYFDISAPGQPPRLYRLVQGP